MFFGKALTARRDVRDGGTSCGTSCGSESRATNKKSHAQRLSSMAFGFRSKCVNLRPTHLKITVEQEQQRQEQQLLQQERQRLELFQQQEQQLELEQLRELQQHRNRRKLEQLRSRLELERNRSSS